MERRYSKDAFDLGNEVAGPRGGGFGKRGRVSDTRPRAADMVDTPSIKAPTDTSRLDSAVRRSVEERGGFPTLNGVPRMTAMQRRAADRERMKYGK